MTRTGQVVTREPALEARTSESAEGTVAAPGERRYGTPGAVLLGPRR
ncbi:hypothetical protein ABZ351_21485 [Streptomyces microflavus]